MESRDIMEWAPRSNFFVINLKIVTRSVIKGKPQVVSIIWHIYGIRKEWKFIFSHSAILPLMEIKKQIV